MEKKKLNMLEYVGWVILRIFLMNLGFSYKKWKMLDQFFNLETSLSQFDEKVSKSLEIQLLL